ncbi:MAG TPA: DUF4431 domain-containing protein [Terriglobales bacterium]|nr:DUF4431 domain-containing protein [Terriglobales bacterium]
MLILLQRTSACLIAFPPLLAPAQLEVAGCKKYQPHLVSLHGALERKTVAGPANYRHIYKGDEPETIWRLKLESPIRAEEDKTQPDLNPREKNVPKVQLVLNKQHTERAIVLRGKKVVATGTLFGAHSGHDHTPLLLTVTYLDAPRWT